MSLNLINPILLLETYTTKLFEIEIRLMYKVKVGETGVSGPWGKWSEIKLFVQIQAHCPLLLPFFMIEI